LARAFAEAMIGLPIASASSHDSQAAILLATMTASRVINLYDVIDSAYDAVLSRSVRN
jgi:hypothetical protein